MKTTIFASILLVILLAGSPPIMSAVTGNSPNCHSLKPPSDAKTSTNVCLIYGGGFPALIIDGNVIARVHLREMSGDPVVFWLSKDVLVFRIAYPRSGYYVVNVSTRKAERIRLDGFDHSNSYPQFHSTLIAYQPTLANGNIGCYVFDLNRKIYLVRADTGFSGESARDNGVPTFSENGNALTCFIHRDWYQTWEGTLGEVWKAKTTHKYRVKLNAK